MATAATAAPPASQTQTTTASNQQLPIAKAVAGTAGPARWTETAASCVLGVFCQDVYIRQDQDLSKPLPDVDFRVPPSCYPTNTLCLVYVYGRSSNPRYNDGWIHVVTDQPVVDAGTLGLKVCVNHYGDYCDPDMIAVGVTHRLPVDVSGFSGTLVSDVCVQVSGAQPLCTPGFELPQVRRDSSCQQLGCPVVPETWQPFTLGANQPAQDFSVPGTPLQVGDVWVDGGTDSAGNHLPVRVHLNAVVLNAGSGSLGYCLDFTSPQACFASWTAGAGIIYRPSAQAQTVGGSIDQVCVRYGGYVVNCTSVRTF